MKDEGGRVKINVWSIVVVGAVEALFTIHHLLFTAFTIHRL